MLVENRHSYNVFLDEVFDVVEIALFADGSIVVAVWQLLPNANFRFADFEQLLHVRRAVCKSARCSSNIQFRKYLRYNLILQSTQK